MKKANIQLREYQQEIINTIISRINNNKKETLIEIPTGAGKTIIIKKLAEILNENILVLTDRIVTKLQFMNNFKDYENIEISTYKDIVNISTLKYKYIIFTELQAISEDTYNNILEMYKCVNSIGFLNFIANENWLSRKEINYYLTLQEILKDGYINPFQNETKFEEFVESLFKNLHFTNISREVPIKSDKRVLRPDFVMSNSDNTLIIEIKNYQSKYILTSSISKAVENLNYCMDVLQHQNGYSINVNAILIVSCRIAEEVKQNYYKEKRVLVLDISNLLYLSQNSKDLMEKLLDAVNYNYDIDPIKPISMEIFEIPEKDKDEEKETNQEYDFIEKLKGIPPGRESSMEYQKLGTEIIKFLFKTEFTKTLEEDYTKDKMFRRDLLCGIKGRSEFWKLIMQHYNSRFVVFEFKNYTEKIDQNLIYITQKYLYNAALRNIAIITSRNGFSDNAYKATTSILTKDGKLIMDLTDDDLITMLMMKADEQDPSDYLLDKLQTFLMSISI